MQVDEMSHTFMEQRTEQHLDLLAQDIPVSTLKVVGLIVDEVNEAFNLVFQPDGILNC